MTSPTPASSASRLLALAGLVALTGLTLAHPSQSRMITWPWVLLTAALWVGPALALGFRLGSRTDFHFPNRWLTAGLGLLAVGAIASALTSPFSAASLVRTWPTLGGVAGYFLLHDWLRRQPAVAPNLAWVAAAGGALVAIVSVIGWFILAYPELRTTRNAVPFGHANYTAGFLVLWLPWLAREIWVARGWARWAGLAALAIGLLALATTSSRGGVLGLVAATGLVALVILIRAPWSKGRKLALVGGLLVVAAGAFLANPRLRDLVQQRSWTDDAQESNRQRTAMLAAGRLLALERPLLGWGPGSVPLAYPRVRAELDGGADNVIELHNTPVQLWATLGLVGGVATLLIVIGTVAAARRVALTPFTVAALTSLTGYAVFSLTDHQLDLPALAAFAALGLAAITATADPACAPASRIRTGWALAVLALGAVPLPALIRDLNARRVYDQALGALGAGQLQEALARLDAATQLTPYDPFFQHQAVGILLSKRDQENDPARRSALTREAIARLEASLRTGTHQEYARFNLGWLQLENGQPQAAAEHFTAAARLVPDKGGVYLGLGLARQFAGQAAAARRAFALEWINDPRSLQSVAWEVPALAALRPAIYAETLRLYEELAKVHPRARTAAAWTRWWYGEKVAPEELGRGFTREAAAFVAHLPALERGEPVDTTAKWAIFYRGWLTRSYPFPQVADDAPSAAALARRRERHGNSFPAFFRAGSEGEDALVRTYRRTRTGYGVLALHPDGPLLGDAYIVQELGLVADFATGLFPPKGWLPGRFLLALLPPDPR